MSLTEQLIDILDFDKEESKDLAGNGPSAASELIKARKQNQQLLEDIVTFKVQSAQLKQKIDPFVQQIADSSTEPPKYWKNVNSTPVENIRNTVKRKREKGEQYSDRHNQKLMAKL